MADVLGWYPITSLRRHVHTWYEASFPGEIGRKAMLGTGCSYCERSDTCPKLFSQLTMLSVSKPVVRTLVLVARVRDIPGDLSCGNQKL